MKLVHEITSRAKTLVPQALAAATLVYFTYHAIHGERGFYAYLQLSQDLQIAERQQAEVARHRLHLEKRVAALRPEVLDLDMLDEQARKVLGYGRSDEIIIFLDD